MKKIKKENSESLIEKISSLNFHENIKEKKNLVLFVEGNEEMCEECDEERVHLEKALVSLNPDISNKFKIFRFNA